MATASDRYDHYFHRYTPEQFDNLLALARHLVLNGAGIDAGGGLFFDPASMIDFHPSPQAIAASCTGPVPPLAHGPLAGIPALPGEDWEGYCDRAFGMRLLPPDPFVRWLQSPLWRRTEASARGAGLRIVYGLDYGIPEDYLEIAMGQAWTNYDRNGFLWDKLALPFTEVRPDLRKPVRDWPEWIGALRLNARREAVVLNSGNLRQRLMESGIARPGDVAGLDDAQSTAIEWALGPMPRSYRQVLSLIGRRAGGLVDPQQCPIYAEQLPGVNHDGHKWRAYWDGNGGDPIPDDVIFIGARDGIGLWFILSEPRRDHPRADSPVFLLDTATGQVRQEAIGVWEWLETFVRDAEYRIAQGLPARNARRGPMPPPMPQDERPMTLALMLGGLLLGAALGLVYWLTT